MKKHLSAAFLLASWFLLLGAAPPSASRILYKIKPEIKGDRLVALRVSVAFPAAVGVVQTLDLPKIDPQTFAADDLSFKGAEPAGKASSNGKVLVRATAPEVIVSYRLRSDGSDTLTAENQGPAIHAGWFTLRGENAFVTPEGLDDALAAVSFADPPQGWLVSTSVSAPRPMAKLGDALLLGGRNYREMERNVNGAPVRLVYPDELSSVAPALLDGSAKILSAERRFWRAETAPFYVGVVQLSDDGGFGGRGADGGFSLYLGKSIPPDQWVRLIAHENLHTWISRAIGGFPTKDDDLEAWLNEGFTEAYTPRMLLYAGLWSPAQVVADWNASLTRYGTSPVKTEPNARILADRQQDFDVNKLPYDRGRILALLWDRMLSARTHGRIGLDDILRAQMNQAVLNAKRGEPISADRLFPIMVKRETGVDLSDDIARYVDKGEPLTLPNKAFGPCVEVFTAIQPVFDRGFDFNATLKGHGRLAGLELGGPADKAGLHEGDKLKIDEIPTHDSRTPLFYKVDDGGGHYHTIKYKPEGSGTVSFQQIKLRSTDASCARSLFRP